MLHLSDLTYTFAGNQVRALDSVSLEFPLGQIHAVIGENGAGKSTLARLCTGHLQGHQGSIKLDDTSLHLRSPIEGMAHGLALVPQHPRLAGDLPVWQNLLLGAACNPENRSHLLNKRKNLDALSQQLAVWKIKLPLEIPARKLDASQVHWVVITEALLAQPRYIFLDEPSAPYGPADVAELYALLRRCADSGMGIIVITHRLQEVLDHADQIHILRHGSLISSLPTSTGLTKANLLQPMFGETESEFLARKPPASGLFDSDSDHSGLTFRGVTANDGPGRSIQGFDLTAPPGLVWGIIGMKDQGLEALEDLLAGVLKASSGTICLDGVGLEQLSPLDRGYIPGRRFQRGIAPGLTILDNAIARSREALFPFGFASRQLLQKWFREGEGFITEQPSAAIVSLSGGMIQRLIFKRELSQPAPRLVIAAEPYWGLDRHFQSVLRDRLIELARQGSVVLFLSSELDDAIETCDRIAVLQDGRLTYQTDGPNFDRSLLALKLVHQEPVLRSSP